MSHDDDFGIVLEESDSDNDVNEEKSETIGDEVPVENQVIENIDINSLKQFDPVYKLSEVPKLCENRVPCCVGIDEAGRGPVLGPMVYGAAYWPISENKSIEKLGFNDSKQLSEEHRNKFYKVIEKEKERIGSVLCELSAEYLSSQMLLRNPVSLNEISYKAAISMIKKIVKLGVHVAEIYVDAVGNCDRYPERLQREFPGSQVVVKPKADAIYKVVGAASIFAKVSRDEIIKSWNFKENYDENGRKRKFGKEFQPLNCSGYPGDERTVNWLHDNSDPVFGFPSVVRFSWKTTKYLLGELDQDLDASEIAKSKENRGNLVFVDVLWENLDPEMEGVQKLDTFLKKSGGPSRSKYFSERLMKHVTSF